MQLIHCLNCGSYLGLLKKDKFFLARAKVLLRDLRLRLRLVAAKDKDAGLVSAALGEVVGASPVELQAKATVVKRSELANYRVEPEDEGVVIVHRAAGRLLLTDDNGIYSPLLQQVIEEKSRSTVTRRERAARPALRRRPVLRDARVLLAAKQETRQRGESRSRV